MKYLVFGFLFILHLNYLSFAQSSFGSAIDFDGIGDYANTFNNPYLPTVDGTLEAWVKVRGIVSPIGEDGIGDAFVAKNEEQWNTGDFYVFFEYSTGLLKSRIQTPPSIEIDVRSDNNFWQHLDIWFHYTFTWGSNGMKMYLNEVLQTNQNGLTYSALNNTYNFYVGGHGYMLHNGSYVVTDFFDGQIDEVRIWNYQKTSEQIISLWGEPLDSTYYSSIDSGLVGYWKFDELEDLGINNDGVDDVRDYSVLHNHIDLTGDAHLVPADIIVPVELTNFTASTSYGKVILNWTTVTEINNLGFEIERKFLTAEEGEWVRIGFKEGQGTTIEKQNYQYIDNLGDISATSLCYRLKQIDFKGSFEYSDEVLVENPAPLDYGLQQNHPNPFNPITTLSYGLPVKSQVVLVIYNSLGESITQLISEEMEAGKYSFEFDATGLSSGIYFYQLQAGSFVETKKMVLMK